MSDNSFGAYRRGSAFAAQRKADRIDEPDRKSGRFSGIFDAINENLKAKDQISYAAQGTKKDS